MGLFSMFSAKGKALAAYKDGMKRAKSRDWEGAIDVYTSVMNMDAAPPDLKAMAQFNRALAYNSDREFDRAKDDLNAVLASNEIPQNIRTAAEEKLNRMQKRLDRAGE